MKSLLLGESNNPVYDFLKTKGETHCTADKLLDPLSAYDWVVSYGYRHILKKAQIDTCHNPILNLHISYLPYNRGADPNYWSWVKNTPKGVTIHAIDEGIDTGDIYIQKLLSFSDTETLSSSYTKLKNEIEILFIDNFDSIINRSLLPFPQKGKGSLHYVKDFPGIESWDTNVKNLIKNII